MQARRPQPTRAVWVFDRRASHDGDGASVLFANGRFEFLKPPGHRQVTCETCGRLGREREFLPKLRP